VTKCIFSLFVRMKESKTLKLSISINIIRHGVDIGCELNDLRKGLTL